MCKRGWKPEMALKDLPIYFSFILQKKKCVILFYCRISFLFLSWCIRKFTAAPQLGRRGKIPQGRLVFVANLKVSPDFFFLKISILCAIFFCICSELFVLQKGVGEYKLRILEEKEDSFTYICIPLTHQTCWLERDALIRNTTKLLYVYFLTLLCLLTFFLAYAPLLRCWVVLLYTSCVF